MARLRALMDRLDLGRLASRLVGTLFGLGGILGLRAAAPRLWAGDLEAAVGVVLALALVWVGVYLWWRPRRVGDFLP